MSQKTSWVIIAIIIIIAIAAGCGIYFWQQSNLASTKQALEKQIDLRQDTIDTLKSQNNTIQSEKEDIETEANQCYSLVNQTCDTTECLFSGALGTATIKGYYQAMEETAWEETETCDNFVITGGSKHLIDHFIGLVDGGNTVNSKNELNQPIISLGLDLLTTAEKSKIKKSTINSQIDLLVFKDMPGGFGAPVCYPGAIVLRQK